MAETLYAAVVRLGLEHDSHESDLYLKDTPKARELLRQFPRLSREYFIHATQGVRWIDVPFAFDPFWARKAGRL